MLVVEKAKAVALKLNNPARVLETIPTAKVLTVQGVDLVVAPHRLDEVRVLRNLGINAPSPILHYYDWVGRHTPYNHQKETAAFLTLNQRGLVLNEIGTGKTQSALWAADYLLQTKTVKKVLILSPLSTLERVWGDAIFTQFPHRKFVVLHGTAERRRKLLKTEADFYIINHDGFNIICDETKNFFDLVIVDEAAVLRNPSTQRFKVFRKWVDGQNNLRLWLMTGTPTPNDPTDAWALAKLVNSPYCTKTYTSFREQVMMKIGQWKFVPRPESVEIVKNILQPSVRYTRDECFDLPDTVIQTRKVELTAEQKKHYTQMLRHFVTEMAAERVTNGTITAVNEAVKIQKLVQIACGVAYGDDGQNIEVDCTPRVNVVKEVIEEAGEKVIVFVPLTGTLHMLERELAKHWTVAVVNGQVSASQRNQIFHDFQHSKDPKVLIAHPATMAHGLTLTSASTVIWYGPITSNEQYVQANGRIERIGKKHVSNVVHIEATDLEYRMYERLRNKQKLQGLLLDLIQQQTNR
jgi:SNF2 family DNA or RNA helicase